MKLSVIIPVYNAAPYLRECLDSVCVSADRVGSRDQVGNRELGTGNWEVEIICVDDGSTDGSGEILDEYQGKVKNAGEGEPWRRLSLVVIHQLNAGADAARNAALDAATGEWLMFADADDAVSERWFTETLRIAEETDADLIRLGAGGPDAGGEGAFEGADALKWAWRIIPCRGFLWSYVVRREIVSTLRFRPAICCKEDELFLLELVPHLGSVRQVNLDGYRYRNVTTSLTKRKRKISQCVAYLNACREIWERQREALEANGADKIARRSIRQIADHDVWEWVHLRDRSDADDPRRIREAYLALERSGAFRPEWCYWKRRWQPAFWLWRRTGSLFGLRVMEFAEESFRRLRRKGGKCASGFAS